MSQRRLLLLRLGSLWLADAFWCTVQFQRHGDRSVQCYRHQEAIECENNHGSPWRRLEKDRGCRWNFNAVRKKNNWPQLQRLTFYQHLLVKKQRKPAEDKDRCVCLSRSVTSSHCPRQMVFVLVFTLSCFPHNSALYLRAALWRPNPVWSRQRLGSLNLDKITFILRV